MAIFGWIILVIFAVAATFITVFLCLFGGCDLSPVGKKTFLIAVAIIGVIWWALISYAPFKIIVG